MSSRMPQDAVLVEVPDLSSINDAVGPLLFSASRVSVSNGKFLPSRVLPGATAPSFPMLAETGTAGEVDRG